MAAAKPFVLLDDARTQGASDAQLFENPRQVFVARRPEEVAAVWRRPMPRAAPRAVRLLATSLTKQALHWNPSWRRSPIPAPAPMAR